MQRMSHLLSELQRLTRRLEADPNNPAVYIQRGMLSFQLAEMAPAIADFDRAEHLKPALTPSLWQRGIAYYYAGRFAEGARQFEIDLTVNGHDVEETVWRYLCQAQTQGMAAARAGLLPVRHDPPQLSLNGLDATQKRVASPSLGAYGLSGAGCQPAYHGQCLQSLDIFLLPRASFN